MSIASTIVYENTLFVHGAPKDHPSVLKLSLGTMFAHNSQDPEKDYSQILETALNDRLGRRKAGVLYRSFETFEMKRLEYIYDINITLLVSWVGLKNGERFNFVRALVLEGGDDNARELMRWVIPLRRQDVRARFQEAMGDVLSAEHIDALTEYYLTEFLGAKRERQKKA